MTEKEKKEIQYTNYINTHINNVLLAHAKHWYNLCKYLQLSPEKLNSYVTTHDKSKFSKEEFDAYRNYFYPCTGEEKNKEAFNIAWKHHYENNKHHPEYWKGKDMDKYAIAEMLLDWEAMSYVFGGSAYSYYLKERDNKELSNNTKEVIDKIIIIFKGDEE